MSPQPLLARLGWLVERLQRSGSAMVCADFDGTLVPIESDPAACQLAPAARRSLAALLSRGHAVAVVSGRGLDDLRTRVGIPGIAYVANHGLEIDSPWGAFRQPGALAGAQRLRALAGEVATAVAGIPGAIVEDKGLSISLHYRRVTTDGIVRLRAAFARATAAAIEEGSVVIRRGKMVWEIRPAVDWHKGRAVEWLAQRMPQACEDALRFYAGDDETDEDVFRAWPSDVTVRVGPVDEPTAARFVVADTGEVAAVLASMAG